MKQKCLILAIFVFASFQIFAQEKVFMPFFEVINMHQDYQYSSSKLFKTYVQKYNKYQIILPDRFDSLAATEPFDVVKQKASDLNCPYFIQGELNRTGEIVVITISMYKTKDGKLEWQSLLKAKSPDDIDPIMEKMAENLGTSTPIRDDIYSVTNYDAQELNKKDANRSFGITIGGGYTFINDIDKNFPAGFGIMGSYDTRNVIFNLKGELYFSDVNIYFFSIDALYPFSQRNNSPFVSGGMGYGGIRIEKESLDYSGSFNNTESYSDSGLFLFGGLGYLLNRNSDVSLRFSGNFYVPSFKLQNQFPVGVLFSTSLLF